MRPPLHIVSGSEPEKTTPISLPAQEILPGDLMDRGMDKLRTVWLALCPDNRGWTDEAASLSIWATLDAAIRELEPVRDHLQNPDGGAN